MNCMKGWLVGTALVACSSFAQASVYDLQCLTSNMQGNEGVRAEYISATREAALAFGISPAILVAIKLTESGTGLNPQVSNHNTNGTVDRGFYQVNTEVWLPELSRIGLPINTAELHGIRANALIAAWIYKRQLQRTGNALEAVGYYHKGGGTGARAERIRSVYKERFMKHLKAIVARCATSAQQATLASR